MKNFIIEQWKNTPGNNYNPSIIQTFKNLKRHEKTLFSISAASLALFPTLQIYGPLIIPEYISFVLGFLLLAVIIPMLFLLIHDRKNKNKRALKYRVKKIKFYRELSKTLEALGLNNRNQLNDLISCLERELEEYRRSRYNLLSMVSVSFSIIVTFLSLYASLVLSTSFSDAELGAFIVITCITSLFLLCLIRAAINQMLFEFSSREKTLVNCLDDLSVYLIFELHDEKQLKKLGDLVIGAEYKDRS